MATEIIPTEAVFVFDNYLTAPTTKLLPTGTINGGGYYSGTQLPRFPHEALLDQRRGVANAFRAPYPGAVPVALFDVGTPITPNAFGLVGSNLTPNVFGAVRFIGGDDATLASGLQGYLFTSYDAGESDLMLWYADTPDSGLTANPHQFWGVYLIGAPLDTYHELHVAILGQRYQFPVSAKFNGDLEDFTESQEVRGGGEFFDPMGTRVSWNVESALRDNLTTAEFFRRVRRNGAAKAFAADLAPWYRSTNLKIRTQFSAYGTIPTGRAARYKQQSGPYSTIEFDVREMARGE